MKKVLLAFLLSALCASASADSPAEATAATSIFRPVTGELADIQRGSVVANGVRLHYVVAGKGEPVVLCPAGRRIGTLPLLIGRKFAQGFRNGSYLA